jgi:hypothetical protein
MQSSSSFSGAAAASNTDKLAVLMALFKSHGLEPPPLPGLAAGTASAPAAPRAAQPFGGPGLGLGLGMGLSGLGGFGSLSGGSPSGMQLPGGGGLGALPMFDSFDDGESAPAAAAANNGNTAAASAAPAAPSASAAVSTTAATPAALDPAEVEAAEIAQLSELFSHARNKVLKLSRLYQSGVLSGAGAQQALHKLGALTRTYYAFVAQVRSSHPHAHTLAQRETLVRDDLACNNVQQMSDRLYKLAQQPLPADQ